MDYFYDAFMIFLELESFGLNLPLRDKNVSGVIKNLNLCFEDEKKIWNDMRISN